MNHPTDAATSNGLFDLPPEIFQYVLDFIVFECTGPHMKICMFSSHQKCSFDCPTKCMLWLTRCLPTVHTRFLHVLAPIMLPSLSLSQDNNDSMTDQDLAAMCSLNFAPILAELRHLRIDFNQLSERCTNRMRGENVYAWIAHISRVCLGATSLESLEWGDLVLNAGDEEGHFGCSYRAFDGTKPFPLDLTCSKLLEALSAEPVEGYRWYNGLIRVITDTFGQDAPKQLFHQFNRIVRSPLASQGSEAFGIGFPHLKNVLFMDGNYGISVDDYANLFLVRPDQLAASCFPTSISDSNSFSNGPCQAYGKQECSLMTAAPNLSSLSIVLWYSRLHISAAFVYAMLHIRKHHPKLKKLELISRRLRYEPRLLGDQVTLDEWFRFDVLPVLQLAQDLLAPHFWVVIHILAGIQQERELKRALKTFWEPISKPVYSEGEITVQLMVVESFTPEAVFREASRKHRRKVLLECTLKDRAICEPSSFQLIQMNRIRKFCS
ncbi:uncharacterized protein MEPE_04350 [Melanopsichium pennsylvanicum]|uniref:Uncharacterized protein n=1 Tax=Melanopsichium pennsylvanicum TaxID=63383 RepID=A0AAJ4XPN0_9BASI|nr:uncharacterized protein MEPE_04350 [Melanopsichium pennsylvanicum]